MAAAKKADDAPLVVQVRFAYATTHAGEVRLLTKGDVVSPERFKQDSIDHLRSIEFVAEQS